MYVQEDDGNGRPNLREGAQVAAPTKVGHTYLGPVLGVNEYKVWKARCYPQPPHGGGCLSDPGSAHLEANTRYWVYVWAGRDSTAAALRGVLSSSQTGAAGWTLGDQVLYAPEGTAQMIKRCGGRAFGEHDQPFRGQAEIRLPLH